MKLFQKIFIRKYPCMSAQESAVILTSTQLSDWVFDWIPLQSRACTLKFKVESRSLCLLQVYASHAVSEYQAFANDVNNAFQRVGSTESIILLGDFYAHIGRDNETWNGVIG